MTVLSDLVMPLAADTSITPGDALFVAFALLIIVSGYFVVAARDVVHAAVSLIFTLMGVAALYVFLEAPFLAAVQVLVYAGGITVLILFGIMLTRRGSISERERTTLAGGSRAIVGSLLAFVLFGLFFTVLYRSREARALWDAAPGSPGPGRGSPEVIGERLLTDYLLPFEVASVLLLVALVGAAYIARRREPGDAETSPDPDE